MSDETTTESNAWSADDPVGAPSGSAEATEPHGGESGPESTSGRGSRAERRAERDQSTRDENARTERDEARERAERAESALETMRAGTVRDRVAEHLANPDDLALVTTDEERAQFWNDDGSLDEGALAAVLDRVLDARPHWRKPPPWRGMDSGNYQTVRYAPSASWDDVIKGR